jgi:hypothetical protein
LVVYALVLLPGLCQGLLFYVISDFNMPAKHYVDIIFTIYRGAIWMIPTAFLLVAYYLSRPKGRFS